MIIVLHFVKIRIKYDTTRESQNQEINYEGIRKDMAGTAMSLQRAMEEAEDPEVI